MIALCTGLHSCCKGFQATPELLALYAVSNSNASLRPGASNTLCSGFKVLSIAAALSPASKAAKDRFALPQKNSTLCNQALPQERWCHVSHHKARQHINQRHPSHERESRFQVQWPHSLSSASTKAVIVLKESQQVFAQISNISIPVSGPAELTVGIVRKRCKFFKHRCTDICATSLQLMLELFLNLDFSPSPL